MWELISVIIDKKFKFDIIPLASAAEVLEVFKVCKKDSSYLGFNIASPWRDVLAEHVDRMEEQVKMPIVDTVYRDKSGAFVGANTDPIAAQRALESEGNLYKCKNALVIGARGAGLSIAHHLYDNLDKITYLYDPLVESGKTQKGITRLASLSEVGGRQYDLIVNATPLGRFYFDKRLEAFTSPLDLETLAQVSHKNTIVQETNYLPGTTLLLQMARHLGLQVVTGDLMLVFGAVESLGRYFGITLDENTVRMLVEEIGTYISERETDILERSE